MGVDGLGLSQRRIGDRQIDEQAIVTLYRRTRSEAQL
jgi:hypothetical protein